MDTFNMYGNRQDEYSHLTAESKADVVYYCHGLGLMMNDARTLADPRSPGHSPEVGCFPGESPKPYALAAEPKGMTQTTAPAPAPVLHIVQPHLVGYQYDCPACATKCRCRPTEGPCAYCVTPPAKRNAN